MGVVICHLSRMKAPNISIGGFDRNTGRQIRLVLKADEFLPEVLDYNGGSINMAKVIELGTVRDVGRVPEIENREVNPASIKVVSSLSQWEFWGLLLANSRNSLKEIFGDDLRLHGYSRVVEKGKGQASLGFLFPEKISSIAVNQRNKIRIGLDFKGQTLFLSLADLRFYNPRLVPLPDVVETVSKRLRSGVKAILSMGLSRAWGKPGEPEYHWLQVNNIHMEDDPTWQVGYDEKVVSDTT